MDIYYSIRFDTKGEILLDIESLINMKYGLLTITAVERRKVNNLNRIFCFCECACNEKGNAKWVRYDSLKNGITTNCGCVTKAAHNLTNREFGLLKVVAPTGLRKNGEIVWKCLCKCGNTTYVRSGHLLSGNTKSCGCLRIQSAKKQVIKMTKKYRIENYIDGTCISIIKRNTPFKSGTTGILGVTQDKRKDKYIAQIHFKGIHYYLGRYEELEDASMAYAAAKEDLHNKFLEQYFASHNEKRIGK